MNISSKFDLAETILENVLISLQIPFVKAEMLKIQDFMCIDYTIEQYNLILQLYYIPETVAREELLKLGKGHLDNRTKYLEMQDKNILSLYINDAIADYKAVRINVELELKAYRKHYGN